MGNHSAGRAMGRSAEIALKLTRHKPTRQEALDLLDMICEPHRGCDAEFEAEDPNRPGRVHPEYVDYTDPIGPLGFFIIAAFDESGRDWASDYRAARAKDDDGEAFEQFVDDWGEGPEGSFSKRYDFC